jgi:hypothetical protein
MSTPAYRITTDDLPDLDHKTARALQPLLESLNASLTNVINVSNATPQFDVRRVTLTTPAAVADVFPFRFSTTIAQPQGVTMWNIIPRNTGHSLAAPFVVQGCEFTPNAVVVKFITGLLPNETYDIVFVVR